MMPAAHSIARLQQSFDDEAAALKVRRLRWPAVTINLPLIAAGPALALAWLLLCQAVLS